MLRDITTWVFGLETLSIFSVQMVEDDTSATRTGQRPRISFRNLTAYCGDQADTKPHHIFGMPVQMMVRQCTAKQRSEPDSAQR